LNGKSTISAEELANAFNISLKVAEKTLRSTTQKGIRTASDVTKRFNSQAWRNKKQLKGKWFSDTMHFPVTDVQRGDCCAQVTTNGRGFTHFHPLQSKGDAWHGLSALINEYGVPEKIDYG